MSRLKKGAKTAYSIIFTAALIIPGIATFLRDNKSIGNEEKTDLSGMNYLNFSDKFDDFFSSSFGFRNELVNMNNVLLYNVFGQSGEDSVIAGSNGWLFYESALHDYIGEDVLTSAEIAKAAKILEMTSEYVKSQGVDFIFASAPNKMEIYGQYMPYYYSEDEKDGNYEMLMDALSQTKVNYADLKMTLKDAADTWDINLYHKEDSHWNKMGAAIAYENIMKTAGYKYTEFSKEVYTINKDFSGDLYSMLFPEGTKLDEQIYFIYEDEFYYTSNFRTPEDIMIETANDKQEKNVLLFRDSFGNALYSFFAQDFNTAVITRQIPYNLTSIEETDLVVIELVERNLGNLLLHPPIIPAQKADIATDSKVAGTVTADAKRSGSMQLITVTLEDIPTDCTDIYIGISDGKETIYYEAFPSAEDADACIYMNTDSLSEDEYEIFAAYEYNGKNTVIEDSSTIIVQR